jgi:hypothetical protein
MTDRLMYRVECLTCRARFLLPNSIDHIPKHPPLGLRIRPDEPMDECSGSGVRGKLIETVYPDLSRPSSDEIH